MTFPGNDRNIRVEYNSCEGRRGRGGGRGGAAAPGKNWGNRVRDWYKFYLRRRSRASNGEIARINRYGVSIFGDNGDEDGFFRFVSIFILLVGGKKLVMRRFRNAGG